MLNLNFSDIFEENLLYHHLGRELVALTFSLKELTFHLKISLVVSTHLKEYQNGSLLQIGLNLQKIFELPPLETVDLVFHPYFFCNVDLDFQ